ncbi:MAG: hypothetical protein ACREAC_30425, partial [Blastocatellia bacterium]
DTAVKLERQRGRNAGHQRVTIPFRIGLRTGSKFKSVEASRAGYKSGDPLVLSQLLLSQIRVSNPPVPSFPTEQLINILT